LDRRRQSRKRRLPATDLHRHHRCPPLRARCATGRPCADFATGGQLELTGGIANITRRGEFEETSAPGIAGNLVIVGSSIADNDRVDSPNGMVRAFDARSGALHWSWDPIAKTLAPTGAGNAWSAISVDAGRGLVFVPTGSASPDYHGLKRPGHNKWADSVVALSFVGSGWPERADGITK
jgi:quinoprotein glucose dehydrogenase